MRDSALGGALLKMLKCFEVMLTLFRMGLFRGAY